jgi:hypothetical protein
LGVGIVVPGHSGKLKVVEIEGGEADILGTARHDELLEASGWGSLKLCSDAITRGVLFNQPLVMSRS